MFRLSPHLTRCPSILVPSQYLSTNSFSVRPPFAPPVQVGAYTDNLTPVLRPSIPDLVTYSEISDRLRLSQPPLPQFNSDLTNLDDEIFEEVLFTVFSKLQCHAKSNKSCFSQCIIPLTWCLQNADTYLSRTICQWFSYLASQAKDKKSIPDALITFLSVLAEKESAQEILQDPQFKNNLIWLLKCHQGVLQSELENKELSQNAKTLISQCLHLSIPTENIPLSNRIASSTIPQCKTNHLITEKT